MLVLFVEECIVEQRSPEWFAARLGIPTASMFEAVLAKTKSGYAATRDNYMSDLICERLTGEREESYINKAMQDGIDREPEARSALEMLGVTVVEVGFLRHPTIDTGCSPDGLIEEDGMVEIKCPLKATHKRTLLTGMPSKHIPQVQGQMWIAGRQWCDFVSYHPLFPDSMRLYVERIKRDNAYISTLESEIVKFLREMQEDINKLENRYAKCK